MLCFQSGQAVTFVPSGTSMLPFLDGKTDKVTLSPKPLRLKKNDVAFYVRPKTGQPVLHRMIGFTKSGEYIFCGDNQLDYEYGIADDDILAVMTAFTHRGKEHQATERRYRFSIRLLWLKKRLRRCASKAYYRLFDRFKNN